MNNNDWNDFFNKFYPQKIDFEKNKHFFTKVAFDVFQLNTVPIESLWILEQGEDGKQYLSATYIEDDHLEVKSDWSAISNKDSSIVVLCYKNFPIEKFSSKDYGFTPNDISIFQKTIVKKASTDKDFVNNIISNFSNDKKEEIIKQFPGLI